MTEADATRLLQRVVLDYDGIVVAVSARRAADAQWIAEVMAPGFSVSEGEAADVEVHFLVDPERFAELERRGPEPSGGVVEGIVLDDSMQRFERWTNAKETAGRAEEHGDECEPEEGEEEAARSILTAFDSEFHVFYEVVSEHLVRITAESGRICRVPLMRVVREFAMDACLRRGDVFLHAASLCIDGRAIVIAGAKSSGKTTSLSWCLQLLGDAQFIANDRVRLRPSRSGFVVRAMPTVVTLRRRGLELLPELGAAVRAERQKLYHRRGEVLEENDLAHVQFEDGRFGLSPSRYPELLRRRSVASAPAGAIVFPEVVDDDDGGLRATEIDASAAARRLAQALFGAGNLGRQSELFGFPEAGPFPTEAQLRERARQVAESIPCYVWKVGSGAPRDVESLRRFVREVSRRAPTAWG